MIVRKRSINPNRTEIAIQTSFGTPDAKRLCVRYLELLAQPLGNEWALQQPISEQGFLHWLEHCPFVEYAQPTRSQLARWAFVQAITNGFLNQSANDRNVYFLSDVLTKKIGRPKKGE